MTNSALRISEKLSTMYAPPNMVRSAPLMARVIMGIMVASNPMPARVEVTHLRCSGMNRSTRSTPHTTTAKTISGASAW
jgi:hypothetical protein